MDIKSLGIDLAKTVFQLHGIDNHGKVVLRKRLSRKNLLPFIANLPSCMIYMEASSGSYYWSRQFESLGHQTRLISPQFVKPYVKTNKNDANDAEAIVEAGSRPNMRFVPRKTTHQQDIQCIHRIRSRLVANRTALSNQIRGLLAEYGIVLNQGIASLRRVVPEILENAENELTDLLRHAIAELYEELFILDERINTYEQQIKQILKTNTSCQRLIKMPGIGPLTATMLVSVMGDPKVFKNGRHFAAFLGLVPRQNSSGNKKQLLGISKRGDVYLRTLLIQGAKAVVRHADNKEDRLSRWAVNLKNKSCENKAAVAVANKNARMAWAMMANNQEYQLKA